MTSPTPSQQVRSYLKLGHVQFSRAFKAHHDADTVEMLDALKLARKQLFVHGVNTDKITAILEKHGVA